MTVTFDLEPELEQELKAQAKARGTTVEYFLHDLVSQQVRVEVPIVRQPQTSSRRRRISERIAEIMADVPAEEFAKLPKDGARHVDHYVYGLPKRD